MQRHPRLSRERIERLSRAPMPGQDVVRATGRSAAPVPSSRPQANCDRQFVRNYRSSHLANQGSIRRMGMEISHGATRRRTVAAQQEQPQPIETGVNRPSAGFQEPASRRFDPFA